MRTDTAIHAADAIRRRRIGILLAWAAVAGVFLGLYAVARRVILNEIRYHARGVAIATAAGIDPADLEGIDEPEDAPEGSYAKVQSFLSSISSFNADVRYIYTMRRSTAPGAKPSDYEFVIDQAPRDANSNGRIDRDEITEPPGRPYSAATLPEMVRAWDRPTADWDVSPDPPYPDLMTGYAPIRNAVGETVAIVGVDVTAATIRRKLVAIQVVLAAGALVLGLLITRVLQSTYEQRAMRLERERLIGDLEDALARVKTLHGLLPICSSCKKVRNDSGYWEQIEKYVIEHSQAEFTHSLCPECAQRLHDEFVRYHSKSD